GQADAGEAVALRFSELPAKVRLRNGDFLDAKFKRPADRREDRTRIDGDPVRIGGKLGWRVEAHEGAAVRGKLSFGDDGLTFLSCLSTRLLDGCRLFIKPHADGRTRHELVGLDVDVIAIGVRKSG